MQRTSNTSARYYFLSPDSNNGGNGLVREAFDALGILDSSGRPALEKLPFSIDDTTAGTETELQVAVYGTKSDVDLPIMIEQSNYLANVGKRAETGDLPKRNLNDIEKFLNENGENIWENSWVRFERGLLCDYADRVFERDLKADKSSGSGLKRTDVSRFVFQGDEGRPMIRVPVSYLVKLAMAQFIGSRKGLIKPREYEKMGFSGFESRQYSLFESLRHDMSNAVRRRRALHRALPEHNF